MKIQSFLHRHREGVRNASVITGLVLSMFFALSLAGIIHFGSPDFAQIRAAVEQKADLTVMMTGDEQTLRKNYGISDRDLEQFVYFAPKSAMDASEILVLEAKEESSLAGFRQVIENRRTARSDMYRNYRPEEARLLEDSVLKVQGRFLIFISSRNVQEVKAALDLSFR
ncbi:DUF4358 domain-containing protein [Clostridiaceae bacterium HFYG-1003]|nr:DUF4358 domain-containing protein [Clostridiaceae bacterium HFYG-1003]